MDTQKDMSLDQVIEKSFDFSTYSEQEKTEAISNTSSMIMETALLRALDEAGEPMVAAFNSLIETEPSDEQMSDFIANNFPNFSEIIIDEIKIMQSMGDEKSETKSTE